jgi:hypothetical protein
MTVQIAGKVSWLAAQAGLRSTGWVERSDTQRYANDGYRVAQPILRLLFM